MKLVKGKPTIRAVNRPSRTSRVGILAATFSRASARSSAVLFLLRRAGRTLRISFQIVPYRHFSLRFFSEAYFPNTSFTDWTVFLLFSPLNPTVTNEIGTFAPRFPSHLIPY
jgi:hypothetical protein